MVCFMYYTHVVHTHKHTQARYRCGDIGAQEWNEENDSIIKVADANIICGQEFAER